MPVSKVVIKRGCIEDYNLLEPEDVENLKIAAALIGPNSVNINVTPNFFFYETGVFYDPGCQSNQPTKNHAALLIGYGIDADFGEFWVVQNSWGPNWGKAGLLGWSELPSSTVE